MRFTRTHANQAIGCRERDNGEATHEFQPGVRAGRRRGGNRLATPRRKEVSVNPSLVSRDPEIMSGAPCFTGTRVPVQHLFDYLEGTSSLKEFLEDFPSVRRDVAVAVLEAA